MRGHLQLIIIRIPPGDVHPKAVSSLLQDSHWQESKGTEPPCHSD